MRIILQNTLLIFKILLYHNKKWKKTLFNYTHLKKFLWSNATCNILISRGFWMNWSFLFEPLHSKKWMYGQKCISLVKTISFRHFCNFDFKKIIIKSIPPNDFSTNVIFLFQKSKVMKRVPRDFTHLSQRVIFFDFILFLFVLLII